MCVPPSLLLAEMEMAFLQRPSLIVLSRIIPLTSLYPLTQLYFFFSCHTLSAFIFTCQCFPQLLGAV